MGQAQEALQVSLTSTTAVADHWVRPFVELRVTIATGAVYERPR